MKMGSRWPLYGTLACTTLMMACSSSGGGSPAADASAGGASTGGAGATTTTGGTSGSSGGAATGGTTASGGTQGSSGGTTQTGGRDAGTGGTPGTDGGDSGTADGGNPLQHLAGYFKVPYPAENPQEANKAMLGQILFWDEQVGELGTMACGSCHRAGAGGSDPLSATTQAHLPGPDGIVDTNPAPTSDDIRGAIGVTACDATLKVTGPAQVTGRKPPTYFDAMFPLQIFWDGRAGYCKNGEAVGGCFYDPDLPPTAPPLILAQNDPTSGRQAGGALEAQAIGPPVNPGEMSCAGQTWPNIAAKLKTVTPLAKAHAIPPDMKQFLADHGNTYPSLFQFVYGSSDKVHTGDDGGVADPDNVINTRRIVFAIATHERRLTSDQTPWDRWNAGDDSAMTPHQIAGFEAFMGKGRCNICHAPPLFTDFAFHFLGFHKPQWDIGREKITNAAANADLAKFKTPSLRNVGLREPGGLLHSGEGPGHDLPTILNLYKLGGFRTDPDILPVPIDPQLVALPSLTSDDLDAIVDFLRNGLTDPRVKADCNDSSCAPFDRPKLSTEP